jgi:hypothetical protein
MPAQGMATKVLAVVPPTCGPALRSRIAWLSRVAVADRAASTGIPLGSEVLGVLCSVATAAGVKQHLASVAGNSLEVRRDSQMVALKAAQAFMDLGVREPPVVLLAVAAVEGDTLVAEVAVRISIAADSTVVAAAGVRAMQTSRKLRMSCTMRVSTQKPAGQF